MDAAKVQAMQAQVRCEINDLIKKKTDTPFSLSSMASVRPFDSFALLCEEGKGSGGCEGEMWPECLCAKF